MAATKYQILYRLMNDTLETPVTNNQDTKYEPLFEFYTDPDHRIFSSDPITQNEEMEKQQKIITEANSANNPKHDMLFVFNGTKKILHQKWVEDQLGYIVRDWQSVRSKVGDNGDYSKEFTTLGAKTPEDGGIVVCTEQVMQQYFRPYRQESFGGTVTAEEVQKAVTDSTIFKLRIEDWEAHAVQGPNSVIQNAWYNMPGAPGYGSDGCYLPNIGRQGSMVTLYSSNIIVDPVEGFDYIRNYELYANQGFHHTTNYPVVATSPSTLPIAWISSAKMYKYVSVTLEDLETITIPGHYEDSPEAPYVIKDQYKRIENSPWIVNSTVGSLEAALTKARLLIDMIGIENVKIIKLVPFDQFVKIQ